MRKTDRIIEELREKAFGAESTALAVFRYGVARGLFGYAWSNPKDPGFMHVGTCGTRLEDALESVAEGGMDVAWISDGWS